jgi:tetratricopeptide (TPR) repeat protein
MAAIRAFVGHSFLDSDFELVQRFCQHFDTLKKIMDFDWETAEAAESRPPADKVIRLMRDKNVFIGICTAKEWVTRKPLAQVWSRVWGRKDQFERKTSDWIIQEIGLARGKELRLILLIENGVRKPGGIQSDVEYIEFDRQNPGAAFIKIAQMLGDISQKSTAVAVLSPVASPPEKAVDDDAIDYSSPPTNWTRSDYEFAFFNLVYDGKTTESEALSAAYLRSETARALNDEADWHAFAEWVRIGVGKGGDVLKLKALAEKQPTSEVCEYLGLGLSKYGDLKGAASAFERASSLATDTADAVRLLGAAARAYQKKKMISEANSIYRQMREKVRAEPSGEVALLQALRQASEDSEDHDLLRAILERLVELNPSDNATRFRLAYLHGENDAADLSLLHYFRIPSQERESGTWNNIGVAAGSFFLPAKAIEAFRKAEEAGNPLATTNIASKLIAAGFLPEAQKQLEAALQATEAPTNLPEVLEKAANVPREEAKRLDEVLEKAVDKSEYFARFGRAVSEPEPANIAGQWIGPDCPLTVTINGDQFIAAGSFDQPENSLLGMMRPFVSQTQRVSVEYRGRIIGRGVEANVSRSSTREGVVVTPSILSATNNPARTLMAISADATEITVMELSSSHEAKFYSISRQRTLPLPVG